MKKFRITFCPHHYAGNVPAVKRDVWAESEDEAFKMAFRMPEAGMRWKFADVSVEICPEGPTVIGVEFISIDTVIGRNFHGYAFIRANSEEEAAAWFRNNLKGHRYSFDPGHPEEDGKCIYGDVEQTYFAACSGYMFDATKGGT